VVTLTSAPPRIRRVPHFVDSLAGDVFAMAELVGFEPMPCQAEVIEGATGIRADGRWAAREVGVNEPRQNGKGGILEMIELTSMFRWRLKRTRRPKLVIHSAHEAITSRMHFDRIWSWIEDTPELIAQVRKGRASHAHGQEGFKLVDGTEMLFKTRTKAGGRGLSCDHLFLDEAMFLPEAAMGALFPSQRARENPQTWYTGSAVDQEVHDHGLVFTRVRDRAISGVDADELAYFEWSLDYDDPELVPEEVFHDENEWRKCTPALGILIDYDYIKSEIQALARRTAAVELLGVGDYPDPAGTGETPIAPELWGECEQEDSELQDPVCLAFDVSPGRRASLAAAGRNQDGNEHIEVIEKLPGTDWLPARLEQLVAAHEVIAIVCDESGPGKSIVPAIEALGIDVQTLSAAEHAQACGNIVDAVSERRLRHIGSLDLWNAIRGASTRPLGDRWAWSRKSSSVDIAPLVAATLALWSATNNIDEDDGEAPVLY
jgi:hypothetical protein